MYTLKIVKKIYETKDACSFELEIPNDLKNIFVFQPGQFLTLHFNINNENLKRSYSISSSPLLDESFKFTVKKVLNGKVSSFLVDQQEEGKELQTSKPLGKFFKKPKDLSPKNYTLFAAGSGITPIFSIMKSLLLMNEKNTITLIYSNRKKEDIIYAKDIELWCENNQERLKVIHCLSQEKDISTLNTNKNISKLIYKNRLNDSLLKSLISPTVNSYYYLCGPRIYMKHIQDFLITMNVSKDRIYKEIFSSSNTKVKNSNESRKNTLDSNKKEIDLKNKILIGDDLKQNESPQFLEVILEGKTFRLNYDGNQNIIETLIQAGYEPPYSCLEGNCMSCLGKILTGTVYQTNRGVLEDENITSREALTCQARGLTRLIKINYDEI